mmetsp:Transcript_13171/g.28137  ORF Transcript_13171/g.28137 Transcript_13171/m.28137 type:complete len:230 (-) Transcript_13171:9369-10058(-)
MITNTAAPATPATRAIEIPTSPGSRGGGVVVAGTAAGASAGAAVGSGVDDTAAASVVLVAGGCVADSGGKRKTAYSEKLSVVTNTALAASSSLGGCGCTAQSPAPLSPCRNDLSRSPAARPTAMSGASTGNVSVTPGAAKTVPDGPSLRIDVTCTIAASPARRALGLLSSAMIWLLDTAGRAEASTVAGAVTFTGHTPGGTETPAPSAVSTTPPTLGSIIRRTEYSARP